MVSTVSSTPATIEEQVYTETTCLILQPAGPGGPEVLGEPMLTGGRFRVRTVVHSDGTRETLTVDYQRRPDSRWSRRKVTSPLDRSARDVDDECED